MTDSFVTQCPHCQTSFRVSHNQLSVARGVVRCGNCLQVFNAARQLLEQSAAQQPPVAPAPVDEPQAVEPERVVPVETVEAPALPVEEPVPAPEPAPAPSAKSWSNVDLDLDHLDLDRELARLEQREIQPSVDFHAAPRREDSLSAKRDDANNDDLLEAGLFSTPASEREPDEPSLDEPLLQLETREPDEQPSPGDRTEPSLSLDLPEPEETPPVRSHVIADEDDDLPDAGTRLSARDDDDLDQRNDHDDEPTLSERRDPELGAIAEPDRPARKESLVDLVDDPLQLDWQKPRSNLGRRLLWLFLILLAAAALAGQYIAYHFDELARQDQYRPWFQQVCPTLGCEVPSKVDIARIKSSNLVVRSHPDFKGALVVDAIIYNRAPFSQPFPLLELRFADLNGQLIASRRFKPAEYLSGELAGKAEMPSQTPIHIALDILDPGPKAVNYSLSFRSPE
ncbi:MULTISPECIES: DUF3426 domain-containing protein [unclassified Pseudomonas]|uniref:DUF3426 domain-containing protein n=1 Tax=unclassified Pseudomonas TaxID=196821 RepID=UPI0021C70137|nr:MULTISPECIES: DUF3426 domain-containing protein [unclassified Pseudomonas]MCU1735714.1 DUF3426 domain-containing protein [Pseudomonas sp. 20P_3.2_Bac4]MCU1744271.1 DUF3426 domain-containing protein [Pseudomonas sp. 20P_3.2_Bac5]